MLLPVIPSRLALESLRFSRCSLIINLAKQRVTQRLNSTLSSSHAAYKSSAFLHSAGPDPSNSSENDSNGGRHPEGESDISDAEWELRTGRNIDVLTESLPHFFSYGLASSIDRATGTPRPASAMHIPIASMNPLDFRHHNEDVETIYSPRVRLSYTPPIALPAPFPKTLHVEGLPLYLASSVFIRHTLNALYSDLHVALRKVIVQTPGASKALVGAVGGELEGAISSKAPRKSREKSLFVGLTVNGVARVSGSVGEWDVNSIYTFSPTTGLIHVHTVSSIEPAPHQAVYDALRSSLGKVFGFGMIGDNDARPGGAGVRTERGPCNAKQAK